MEPVFLGVAVYPVTVVLAPTVGCLVAWLAPPPPGASRGRFLVLTLLLALAMLAGAKGYYYVEQVWSGMGPRVDFSGGYRQPGVFLGLLCLPIFARVILPRTAVGTILDSYVVPVACGIVVFRIGCLFQGCCFGAPTDLPWGIQYPRASPVWHHQVAERTIMGYEPTAQPVHPLHVYFASAVVFAAAVSRIVKSRAAPGLAFLVFIVLAEGSKAYLETLRPAPRHGVDTAQVFHAVTATAAATIIVASCAVRYGWTQRGRGAR